MHLDLRRNWVFEWFCCRQVIKNGWRYHGFSLPGEWAVESLNQYVQKFGSQNTIYCGFLRNCQQKK